MRAFLLSSLLMLSNVAAASGGGEHVEAEAGGHGAVHIPWDTLAFHAINLAIFVGLIVWLAGPKVKDALANRAAGIRRQLQEAERVQAEAKARYDALEARLAGFEGQLASMRAEAEAEAAREQVVIDERAARDAAMVREAARRTVDTEVARARQELRREAVQLAVGLAETQIKGSIGPADQERFAADFLVAVKADDGQGVTHG